MGQWFYLHTSKFSSQGVESWLVCNLGTDNRFLKDYIYSLHFSKITLVINFVFVIKGIAK